MAVNEWWDGDARQRYWMEITDRDDLGDDLHAPQTDQSGKEYWSYDLVNYVRPGDVVLHWWKQQGQDPAFVAFSEVLAQPRAATIRWKPHGPPALTGPLDPYGLAVVWLNGGQPGVCPPTGATSEWGAFQLDFPSGASVTFRSQFDTTCGVLGVSLVGALDTPPP